MIERIAVVPPTKMPAKANLEYIESKLESSFCSTSDWGSPDGSGFRGSIWTSSAKEVVKV